MARIESQDRRRASFARGPGGAAAPPAGVEDGVSIVSAVGAEVVSPSVYWTLAVTVWALLAISKKTLFPLKIL